MGFALFQNHRHDGCQLKLYSRFGHITGPLNVSGDVKANNRTEKSPGLDLQFILTNSSENYHTYTFK